MEDRIQCQECGNWYKALSTHLHRAHDMTPGAYREKHGLARTDPLMAAATINLKSEIGKRRMREDPRVSEALTGEGQKRGHKAALPALRQARSAATSARISRMARERGDHHVHAKLAAAGFDSLQEAADWAQSEGLTWTQMCNQVGLSPWTTRERAEREGVEVWTTIPPRAREMLRQARVFAGERVGEAGSLSGTTGPLSRWLSSRRWWTSHHDPADIDEVLTDIDPDWQQPRR